MLKLQNFNHKTMAVIKCFKYYMGDKKG